MSRESMTAHFVAQAIDDLWTGGRTELTVQEVAKAYFKDVPVSAPLIHFVRNQISPALRLLSELGRLGHPVTAYFFKLPVRNGVRRIPLDTVNRRKCVPLAAGPKATFGVRMVESKDDPLLLEALSQTKLMTAGSVKEFERRQHQAKETGLLTDMLADVRDPSWFDHALLEADPQIGLPLVAGTGDKEDKPGSV